MHVSDIASWDIVATLTSNLQATQVSVFPVYVVDSD